MATNWREKRAPEEIRTPNLLIRSQMLYPVELRAPLEEQLICGGRARRSNNAKKLQNFPAAFKVKDDLLTQGYGVDRAKIIHPTSHPPASLCEALRARIAPSGMLRPYITKQ
jgi:hypothetical protein